MNDRVEPYDDADPDVDVRLRAAFTPNDATATRVTRQALRTDRRPLPRFLAPVAAATVAFVAVAALVALRSNPAEAQPSVRLTSAGSVAVASTPAGEIWVVNRIEPPQRVGGTLVVVRKTGGE